MCSMGKIAACELSFLPIESNSYAADVNRVIEIIEKSGLNYRVGDMSTLLWGKNGDIFHLLDSIYSLMDGRCAFTMVVKISNICGCAFTTL